MITVRELVDGLGGGANVARQIGVTAAAVSHWIAAGAIPPNRETQMWALAAAAGLDWSPPGAAAWRLAPRQEAA